MNITWDKNYNKRVAHTVEKVHTTKSTQIIAAAKFEFSVKIHSKSYSTMVGVTDVNHTSFDFIGNGGKGWSWYCERGTGYAFHRSSKVINYLFATGDTVHVRIDKVAKTMQVKKNNEAFRTIFTGVDFPAQLRLALTLRTPADDIEFMTFTDLSNVSNNIGTNFGGGGGGIAFNSLLWDANSSKVYNHTYDAVKTINTKQAISSNHFNYSVKILKKSYSTMIGVTAPGHNANKHIGNGGKGWAWYCERGQGYSFNGSSKTISATFATGDTVWVEVDKNKKTFRFKKNNELWQPLYTGVNYPGQLKLSVTCRNADDHVELLSYTDLAGGGGGGNQIKDFQNIGTHAHTFIASGNKFYRHNLTTTITIRSALNISARRFEFAVKVIARPWSSMMGICEVGHKNVGYIGNGGKGWCWYCENTKSYKRSQNGGSQTINYSYNTGDTVWILVDKNARKIQFKKNFDAYRDLFTGVDLPYEVKIAVTTTQHGAWEITNYRDLSNVKATTVPVYNNQNLNNNFNVDKNQVLELEKQIAGLKNENSVLMNKMRMMESDNKRLITENIHLKKEMNSPKFGGGNLDQNDELFKFLQLIQLTVYFPKLKEEKVVMRDLEFMEDEDLMEIIPKKFHRKRMMHEIKKKFGKKKD